MRRRKLRTGSKNAKMFRDLVESLDDFFTLGFNPGAVMRFGFEDYNRIRDAKDRNYHRQMLRKMAEKKLINFHEKGNDLLISITKDGMAEYLRLKLQMLDFLPAGKVCMVVFDIPETQRNLRQEIRRLLTNVGFIPTQRSVWISPFDAGDILAELFRSKEGKPWIKCYTAQQHHTII